MTTEPLPQPTEPGVRGTPIDIPPPDLGRCFEGITEWGFMPCEDSWAATTDQCPTDHILTEDFECVQPVVEAGPPPHLPVATLPATGASGLLLVMATMCVIVGGLLQKAFGRCENSE